LIYPYSSKIATRLDQIVDVFYVKDREGRKLTDPDAIREVTSCLRNPAVSRGGVRLAFIPLRIVLP
jgi:hypothetical protein